MSARNVEGVSIQKLSNLILENVVHENVELDVVKLHEIKAANTSLIQESKYGVLVDSHPSSTITKEGRELTSSKEFQQRTIAKALLIRSMPHRLVGKIYIKLNKPHITTKIFDDRKKALEWLENQVEQTQY